MTSSETPPQINCGTTCSASYSTGTVVTLTAQAAAGSTFAGWSNCDTVSNTTCTVTMNASRSVTATFNPQGVALTVMKAGTGSGAVTSSETPPKIDCEATCGAASASYDSGTVVTLTAAPASGSTFGSWSGCDTVSGSSCTVTMNASRSVTATFNTQGVTLTVNKAGTGSGAVISSETPPKIDCEATCTATSASYDSGTTVTLSATPASGSTFASWSGCDTVSGPTCTVTMNAARSVTATFNAQGFTLTVTKGGTGSGVVTSSETPPKIDCEATCAAAFAPYDSGTTATLTAAAASGSTFASWSGCDGVSGSTCTVTMNAARSVTATFNAQRFTLTVAEAGTGSGSVTSSDGSIGCPGTCAATYNSGTTITLTAAPASGSTFASWSGCDGVSGSTCTVTMNAARSVTATFNAQRFTLTVAEAGTGSGSVTSSDGAIGCPGTCAATYNSGTTVTLTAAPDSGSTFASWSGCSAVSGSTCTVTMSAARSVTATFNVQRFTLSVSVAGIGSGSVTSSDGAIGCPGTCSATYDSGSSVTLTANANLGSLFSGWSGACSGLGSCTVTMNAARSVTATFVGVPLPLPPLL